VTVNEQKSARLLAAIYWSIVKKWIDRKAVHNTLYPPSVTRFPEFPFRAEAQEAVTVYVVIDSDSTIEDPALLLIVCAMTEFCSYDNFSFPIEGYKTFSWKFLAEDLQSKALQNAVKNLLDLITFRRKNVNCAHGRS
jgi:hypothetical protein